MKNKLGTILLVLVLMFSFMLNVNAETIKEDTSTYDGDVYIIGSSKFDSNIIVTGTMASVAGAREAYVQYIVNQNLKFKPEDVKIYYYSELDETWSILPETSGEELKELTEEEVKEFTEDLNIYFVNEEEKTIEVPYETLVEDGYELKFVTNDESHNDKVKYENGKLILPATVKRVDVYAVPEETLEGEEPEEVRLGVVEQNEGVFENTSSIVRTYEELLFALGSDAETIRIEEDIDLPTALEVTRKVEIYLNGADLTVTEDTAGDGVFKVVAGGHLTINGEGVINGVGDNIYNIAIWANGGEVVINGGTYTNVGAGADDHYDLIYAKNGGKVTINGGRFIAHTPKWTLNLKDRDGSEILVKGGEFVGYNPAEVYTEPTQPLSFVAEGYKVTFENGYFVVSELTEKDVAVVNGLTYESLSDAVTNAKEKSTIKVINDIELSSGVVFGKEVTLDLNGKTIKATKNQSSASLFMVSSTGKLTITGNGFVNSASNGNDYSMAVWAYNGGEVIIENGTFTNLGAKSVEDNGVTPNNNELIYASGGGKITINGGKYVGNTDNEKWGTRYTLNLKDSSSSEILVKGGTFVALNPGDVYSEPTQPLSFVAPGYKVAKSDEEYTVVPAVETDTVIVNAVNYETLEEAVAAATAKSTVTVVKDIVLEKMITINKELTLDLNGHKIDVVDDFADYTAIYVNGGKLTITGDGMVDSASQGNDYSMAVWVVNNGEVVIENGTFTNLGAKSVEDNGVTPNNNELIYAYGGKVTINGGRFIGNTENEKWGTRYTLNLKDNTDSEILVKGGTFVALNPSDVYSEPTQPLSFVAPNFKVVKSGNEYTVMPYDAENVTDELELHVLSGTAETIKLGADIKLNTGLIITKELTLDLNGHKIDVVENFADYSVFRVDGAGKLTITGNGTVDSASQGNDYSMAVWATNGGEVVIEDGTFTNLGAKSVEDNGVTPNNNELIYAYGGKVTINGGRFIGNTENEKWGTRYTLNLKDNTGSEILVKGGTFVALNPEDIYSEPTQPLSFVAEGYKSVEKDGSWEVLPITE